MFRKLFGNSNSPELGSDFDDGVKDRPVGVRNAGCLAVSEVTASSAVIDSDQSEGWTPEDYAAQSAFYSRSRGRTSNITRRRPQRLVDEVVGFEGGVDAGTVEADDDVATDVNYRDATLAGFIHSLQAVSWVFLDVFVGVLDA